MAEREVSGKQIRVLVLDSSAIHTKLLADALGRDRALDVVSLDRSKPVVKSTIEQAIDVLVIGTHIEEQAYRGFEVLRELRSARPVTRAVVLIDSSRPQVVLDAFRAGARGIFSRSESIEKLCKCIRCVHMGQIWANSRELSLALDALASAPAVNPVDANGVSLLSKREKEIVESLTEGLTNREIAERLGLSQHTVKNYLFRIFDKLGVSSRVELLFMTLSQEANSHSVFSLLKNGADGAMANESVLAECQESAEQGSPVAQMILSQLYWTRRSNPTDVLLAYKWCLIARAQLSRTTKDFSKTMTMEQLLYAEKIAADWLRKTQEIGPSSIAEIGESQVPAALSAASD